jgi:hypothetical protein
MDGKKQNKVSLKRRREQYLNSGILNGCGQIPASMAKRTSSAIVLIPSFA